MRFVYKKDQVYLYNGCWDLSLYRVTHVPLFGSPSFNLIHLSTFREEEEVHEDIRYAWKLMFNGYYQIDRHLQKIPYEEYIPIEKLIIETEEQIDSIVKDAVSRGNHPSVFKTRMTLFQENGYIYHLEEPRKEPVEWLVSRITLNDSLPLHEEGFRTDFEDDDKPDYIVIPESVWYQIEEIGKDRHAVLQKMLLSIKDRYKVEDKQKYVDASIVYPWGIY